MVYILDYNTSQSMLLGATFPLMAAGFIRRFPGSGGYKLTFLYFAILLEHRSGYFSAVLY
jgi:hypothetical protein